MTISDRRCVAAAVVALVTLAGCGRSSSPRTGAGAGQTGVTWLLTVSRQPGGTVTTRDGKIECGTAPSATRCGPVAYGWSETATLVATADDGYMFGTWAGDCSGRTTVGDETHFEYVCTLDTKTTGADKYVVAVFGEAGRTAHPNFTDPAIHGPAFLAWVQGKADAFECTHCHGATYAGLGLAPSCNDCHARAGFPSWQTNCTFCHGAPPAPPPTGLHPSVSSDLTLCFGCHQTTVDPSGTIIPGGTHLDGSIEATGGHADGYADPAVHGRDFFQYVAGDTGLACAGCHGAAYDVLIATGRKSCNSCHAESGWVGWQTNCSFCHGVRDATTKPGYAVADHPTWSAPPDAIAQRLGAGPVPERTGAHAIHLTGSALAGPVRCDACHLVPTTLGHISGREARAVVALTAPGQAAAADLLGYDAETGTCSTACHGAGRSPAWSSTGLQCNGCHAVPPATQVHAGLSGTDLGACAGCHPGTVTAAGTIDTAGGKHVNGAVDVIDGHASGFAAATVHGPQYLDALAGVSGASDCKGCHGASLGNCDACHASAASGGWVRWQTNCTFCHGTRKPAYTSADLALAAPPHGVSQRLTGTVVATVNGKHGTHLSGTSGAYAPTPCATCHPVPADAAHVSASRKATVVIDLAAAFPNLTEAQLGALPNAVGTYDPSTNRCTTYCHGIAAWGATSAPGTNPRWTTAAANVTCTSCHGSPPPTGRRVPPDDYCDPVNGTDCSIHEWHLNLLSASGWDTCGGCHSGNVHLNGVVDVSWYPGQTGTWDPVAKTCSVSCHASATPRSWN